MWYQKMSHGVSKKEPSGTFLSRISVGIIIYLDCHAYTRRLKNLDNIMEKGLGGFKV